MANRGRTIEVTQWHNALAEYLATLRRANGAPTTNKKTLTQSLLVAYARQTVAGITDPAIRTELIALITKAESA